MWTCRKCNAEVEDHFEICWSCGTSVDGAQDPGFRRFDADEDVPAPAEVMAPKPSEAGTATVATYWVAGQAQDVQSRLEAIGVPVVVAYEFGVATDWFLEKATGSIHLQVAAADVEKARRFLADHPTAPLPPAPPKPPEPDEETRYKAQPWLAPVPKDLSPFEELRYLESQLSALIDSKDVPDWKVNPSFHPDVMAFIQRHANNVGFVQKAQGLQRNRAKYFATIRTQLLAPKPPEEEKPKEERPARPSVLRRLGGALVRRLVLGPLRLLRRLLKWTAILLIVAAVGVVLMSVFYNAYAEKQLYEAVAETEEKDPNWTWEALQAQLKPIADKDNAALMVAAVGTALAQRWPTMHRDQFVTDEFPERPLPAAQLAELRAALLKSGEELRQARGLVALSSGRWPDTPVLEDPDDTATEQAEQRRACRAVINLLWADAAVAAQDDQAAQGLISVRAILAVGRSSGDDPGWSGGWLFRAECDRQACGSLARVLAEPSRLDDQDLAALQRDMERECGRPMLLNYGRRGRANSQEFYAMLQRGDPEALRQATAKKWVPILTEETLLAPIETWLRRGQFKLQQAELLRGDNDLVAIARLPIEEQVARLRGQASKSARAGSADYLHQTIARLRCTSAALATERYRLASQTWPSTWEALVPKYLSRVPIDPYDTQPLRLRRGDDGLTVYSIGPDSKEISFRLWDVKHRGRPKVD